MGWKNFSYWFKGGIIGLIIGIICAFIRVNISFKLLEYLFLPVQLILWGLFPDGWAQQGTTIIGFIMFATYGLILGVLIGWIVGKVKGKSVKKKR